MTSDVVVCNVFTTFFLGHVKFIQANAEDLAMFEPNSIQLILASR